MANEFSAEDVQSAIDQLTDQLVHDADLLAVEFTMEGEIQLRYRAGVPKGLPSFAEIVLSPEGDRARVAVAAYSGPEIVPAIGDVDRHPPLTRSPTLDVAMGGDQCRNANAMNFYGTISFFAGTAVYTQHGKCNVNMRTSPVLISNNHVLARSDAAQLGEGIWTPSVGTVAKLDAFLPIDCNGDLAFAQVTQWGSVRSCHVQSIGGVIADVQVPKLGEDIRKHGARTGYTGGIVGTQGNINVQGRWYRGVWGVSRGFACPGDSGSLVVRNDARMLGLHSWGENIPCEDDPRGWFWPLPAELPGTTPPRAPTFGAEE
jgi:hypothetical protein